MREPHHDHEPQDDALQAPPKLAAALQRLAGERVFIPRTLDDAILSAARRHLGRPAKPPFNWVRLTPWVAAAAAVVILAVVPQFTRKRGQHLAPEALLTRADINHDGQVDILDAFALARRLKTGATPGAQMDIDGDGVVDERDVAALAARAVRLPRSGHS